MAVLAPGSDVDSLLSPVRRVLAALMRSNALTLGDQDEALAQLTEVACRVLRVARASVWVVDEGHTHIDCVDLYETKNATHSKGASILAASAPHYFEALREARTIAAADAVNDVRTREFGTEYLPQHGITSMLDAPVLVRGRLAGIVCLEHIGPARRWEFWEELVAGSLADFVAMVLGATEYLNQAAELQSYRTRLEALVELKTRALVGAEQSFGAAFAAAPIALLITRLRDEAVVTANPQALKLFETSNDQLDHFRASEFWVDLEQRKSAVTMLLATDRVDGLVTQLRTRTGRVFWGELNLRRIEHGGEPCLIGGVRDVTDQLAAEAALRHGRDNLRQLFDAAPSPLFLLRAADGVIIECNEQAALLFGRPRTTLVGQRTPELFAEPTARAAFLALLAENDRVEGFEAQLHTTGADVRWGLINARQLVVDGAPSVFLGLTDVTEQKRLEANLRALANTDGLTGALNRRAFDELAKAEHARSERTGRPFTVAMLDLDWFKQLNDKHGHLVGDDALRMVRKTVQQCIRRVDVLARYGGEEFVLVLPETTLAAALPVLERVRQTLSEQPLPGVEGHVSLTVSIGAAAWKSGESFEAQLRRADEALYEAKRSGRNAVRGG